MTKFSDHQLRLWKQMLQLFDEYKQGSISLSQLVGKLEGCLDAADFKDKDFIQEWYSFWGPLEEANGVALAKQEKTGKYNLSADSINVALNGMETFLKERFKVLVEQVEVTG